MRRNTLNYALDALSLTAMLGLAATGLLMKFTLPPGSGSKAVWGLGRHAWGSVHFWVAATLIALLVLHVALHWAWVYASTRRLGTAAAPRPPRSFLRERVTGIAFLGGLVLLLAGFLFVAQRSVVAAVPASAAEREHGEAAHEGSAAEAGRGLERAPGGSTPAARPATER